jgi:putative tricarboxylic transport membrane protein
MRRDTFLKILAALAATGSLPLTARAAANLKMMIPANPGGGWDTTGRALGKALQDAGGRHGDLRQQGRRRRRHRPGAVRQRQQGRPERADGDGRRDAGRHHHRQAAGEPDQATPMARLTSEYNVFVLPANSPLQDHEGRGRADEEGPRQREVGRRLARVHRAHRGAMIAREVGVDPERSTTCPSVAAARPRRPSWAATSPSAAAATASSQYIESGKMRAIAVTSGARLKGINVPTLKEQGINVEIGNWRGVYGAPGITPSSARP